MAVLACTHQEKTDACASDVVVQVASTDLWVCGCAMIVSIIGRTVGGTGEKSKSNWHAMRDSGMQ